MCYHLAERDDYRASNGCNKVVLSLRERAENRSVASGRYRIFGRSAMLSRAKVAV